MRVALVLCFGIAAIAAFPHQQEPDRIIGGSLTTINQYPYAVAMLSSFVGILFSQSCGGTIINNRSILTAAHCFIFQPSTGQWRMRIGSSFANSGGTVLNTAHIIRHSSYSILTNDHDYAIVQVSGTINWVANTVAPASIAGANYNLADQQTVWAIGWGVTETGSASEQLRDVQVWTVNQQVCAQRYAERGLSVTASMLCSGWLDVGGRDQCQGDSGGPLLHNNVIVGICSWGIGCAEARFPGVNARVSFASNWIVANA